MMQTNRRVIEETGSLVPLMCEHPKPKPPAPMPGEPLPPEPEPPEPPPPDIVPVPKLPDERSKRAHTAHSEIVDDAVGCEPLNTASGETQDQRKMNHRESKSHQAFCTVVLLH